MRDGADAKHRYYEYESQAVAAYAAEHGGRGLRYSRHLLQMDLGHITQVERLQAIALLGTEVAPKVRAATGSPLD